MQEFLNSFQKLEFDKVRKYIRRYAVSGLGAEHIDQLIPSGDPAAIRRDLALVTEMKQLLETDEALPFDHLFDIRTSLQRSGIENYSLAADELHHIALVLITSRLLQTFILRRAASYPMLGELVRGITPDKVLEFNIRAAIDDDGNVKDSASRELASIRREIAERNLALRKSLESILRSVVGKEWIQEEIITTRDGRMVIPVKVEHKNRVPGFIHSASASGATVFVEPTETLEVNNEIRTLQFREQREIASILSGLTGQVRAERDALIRNVQVLGELDFIHAKAKYSIEIIGAAPVVQQEGAIRLRNAYHPLLLQRHGRKAVVPLTIEIPEDRQTLVITGPNAGGKSVLMKTVGLLNLMVQSGCHIPATPDSEVRVFENILVDMGDEQSIENDLSSFSSHLQNLAFIISHAAPSSLILIDEIGSGTDPSEGSSIAAAVLERLTAAGSTNVVTTHHGMLKTFAFDHPGIQNGAMEFDQATLQPTFRYRSGVPGSSYAIEMAERMHFPKEIIGRARELKGVAQNKLENLIIDLERQSQDLRANLEAVNAEKTRLTRLNTEYEGRVQSLEKELKEKRLKAAEEATRIVEKANAVIENSVREIRERAADRQTIRKVKDTVGEARKEISSIRESLQEPQHSAGFEPGDMVRLKGGTSEGQIGVKVDEEHYIVHVGDLRVKIHRNELELKQSKGKGARKTVQASTVPIQSSEVRREIDLRGMYGDEAIQAVDKFIDDAVLAGLHRIDLIHGKGTGALRKKITEFLKSHHAIKSFRLGEWNEGGTGVTVVEL